MAYSQTQVFRWFLASKNKSKDLDVLSDKARSKYPPVCGGSQVAEKEISCSRQGALYLGDGYELPLELLGHGARAAHLSGAKVVDFSNGWGAFERVC